MFHHAYDSYMVSLNAIQCGIMPRLVVVKSSIVLFGLGDTI